MPLTGDYEPSTASWARRQAERYEASNGAEEAWPDYARYQAKTSRQIPVFVLEPI
jgi:hypothetical protein